VDCSIQPAAPDLMQRSAAQRPDFVAEIECVNRQLMRVLGSILEHDPEAVVVVNVDHGSACRQKFNKPPNGWSAEDVRERLGSWPAVLGPVSCRFRVVGICLKNAELPLHPDRHFITPYNDDSNLGIVIPVTSLLPG
jgi:hypothetical protein